MLAGLKTLLKHSTLRKNSPHTNRRIAKQSLDDFRSHLHINTF